mmetsp:Transcript_31794/g.46889  ORF Transcript_31794/g.46889 Transcript_31794/m.46889 type:complete len:220 (+) Transcript_31794:44-703(+)
MAIKRKRDEKELSEEQHPKHRASKVEQDLAASNLQEGLSCFKRKKIRMLFSLYPSDLHDVHEEIRRSLKLKLLRYIPGIEGVLIAFDDIKLVTSVPGSSKTAGGIILNEQPQIHYLSELDTLLFCPQVGKVVAGKVTECYESHVGLLVNNFFNASITSDHLQEAGFSFLNDGFGATTWVHKDGSAIIASEETITFTIEKVHECAGTISMEGSHASGSSN